MLETPISAAGIPPHPSARAVVRDLLTSSAAYHGLDPQTRKDIASSLVRISSTALALAEVAEVPTPPPPPPRPPAAMALANAGQDFSGVAADKVAGTTKAILNAVSFPRFVTELINGVFKAMINSNQQQMASYVELIKNVAATTEGFADANIGVGGARDFLVEKFPGSFVVQGPEDDTSAEDRAQMTPEEKAEADQDRARNTKLALRPGASMPTEPALRTALGLAPGDSVPSGDPESLVGVARAAMAKNRQQTLSTMVMMGLQRIVIDSGRLSASMQFHIDTHSAAADDHGSSFDERNDIALDVGAKVGPWGVNAQMKNTIGFVSTERSQTTEAMNTDLNLNSSVELVFRTDYVPLERLAGTGDVNRIRVNTLNPDAEIKLAADARKAREGAEQTAESARSSELDKALHTPTPQALTPPKPPGGASPSPPAAQQPAAKQDPAAKQQQPAAKQDPAAKQQQPAAKQQPPANKQPAGQQPAPAKQQPAAHQPPPAGAQKPAPAPAQHDTAGSKDLFPTPD